MGADGDRIFSFGKFLCDGCHNAGAEARRGGGTFADAERHRHDPVGSGDAVRPPAVGTGRVNGPMNDKLAMRG